MDWGKHPAWEQRTSQESRLLVEVMQPDSGQNEPVAFKRESQSKKGLRIRLSSLNVIECCRESWDRIGGESIEMESSGEGRAGQGKAGQSCWCDSARSGASARRRARSRTRTFRYAN